MKFFKHISLILLFILVGTISASSQFSLGVKVSYETDLGFDDKWTLSDGQMNFIADPSQGFTEGFMLRFGKRLYVLL